TSVLVRYVFAGDANLDGFVNGLDFNALAINFGGSGKQWVQADFNYDGLTNSMDFNAIAMNFNFALPAPAAEMIAPLAESLAPEPVGGICMILPFLLQRRRKASHNRRFL